MKRYEQIPHTADIALRVYGKDLKELFINAACGMFDIIADTEEIKSSVTIDINLEAPSKEELLVCWLDELLYNFETKKIIFSEFNITSLGDKSLSAKIGGCPVGGNKTRLKTEIKAATYHDLKIKEEKNRLTADIIFDV